MATARGESGGTEGNRYGASDGFKPMRGAEGH
jgi:hypothetical protein